MVGAGPVGLAAALLLARYGVRTLVLEARPARETVGSRAICMQRDVLDVLDRVDCAREMVACGVTWTRGKTFYRDHLLFETTFTETGEEAFPPFVNIPQTKTEEILEARALAEPLVELRYGCQVTDVRQSADEVIVTLAPRAGEGTGEIELAGCYLVAADGARSRVRKALDISFDGYSFDDRFLIADIRAELDFALERRFFFDPAWNPGRQVLVHPQPDSVWRIDWQVPADHDLDAERQSGALDRRIREITGERDYKLVWASSYRFHQRRAARFGTGRCFLVGDAAHLMAPFGARGLNSGVQDAENLAWKLGWVSKGWAASDLLDTYRVEREAAADENLRVTGATMDFLVPRTEEGRARRRRVLELAVTDEKALAEVDSGKLAEPYCYSDSPLTARAEDAELGCDDPALGAPCPDWGGGPGHSDRLRASLGLGTTLIVAGRAARAEQDWLGARARVWYSAPLTVVDTDSFPRPDALKHRLGLRAGQGLLVRPDGHVADRFVLT